MPQLAETAGGGYPSYDSYYVYTVGTPEDTGNRNGVLGIDSAATVAPD